MFEYRVYDKKEGRYLDCNNAPMLGMNGELFFHQKGATWATSEEPDRYVYEPSVGRSDVNGTLIYAGDLVECLADACSVYLVEPNNWVKDIYYDDGLGYYMFETWKPRIVGNVHDARTSDAALYCIYVVEKNWNGLLSWLLDWGWTIQDLLKYENANDLFHDIVKNERKCAEHWYTDHFACLAPADGDTVYVNETGDIVQEDDPNASRRMVHSISRFNCRRLLEHVRALYQ